MNILVNIDLAHAFGHFTYLLLILSMLMRRMVWLRSIAILAGLSKVVYRSVFVLDPVSVIWETIFVLVNIGELMLTWWLNRPPRLSAEQQVLRKDIAPYLSNTTLRSMLKGTTWQTAEDGAILTKEGEPVGGLIYIADGVCDILRDETPVARCGKGDFLGEMTWETGLPATATAQARGQVRYCWFERERLLKALRKHESLRYALQVAFNRNLIHKLSQSTSDAKTLYTVPGTRLPG